MTKADGPAKDVERRDTTAPRINYEALVEVGSRSVGGFEAEAVDVSLDGIRLRTAYLPSPGERLVCRFDGFGGEIVAEGQVAWCHDEGRGGEFGVRFTRLDARALDLLKQMCEAEHAPAEQGSAPAAAQSDAAQPGARVRLHIQGLGSPMRARVRDVARGEVLIGSNLEFLRVGRDVELEDVERGSSRVAHIEHVSVDIDPETSIPQLVVALVYQGDAMDADDLTTAPLKVRAAAPPHETTPEPTVIDSQDEPAVEVAPKARVAPARQDEEDAIEDDEHDEHEDEHEPAGKAQAMAGAAAAHVGAVARRMGPVIAKAGVGAGAAIGRMIGAVKRRSAEKREERERARAPKRTTAPPPSGALRSNGRKLFREQQRPSDPPPETEASPAPPKNDRKRTVFGAVLGLMAVVAIYFASSHLSRAQEGAPAAAASAPAEQPSAAPGDEALDEPSATGAVATANVPLFGATPLSTTEPVPVPTNLDGKAPPPGKDAKAEGGEAGGAKKAGLVPEWGFGEVENPLSLRIKMNGKLEGIKGAENPSGFTITVPGRHSVSSASGLARKDKRLDSVNVVNYPDRAEVTVRFKGEVPPFMAKAKLKALVIEISNPKPGKGKDKSKDKDDDKDDDDDKRQR